MDLAWRNLLQEKARFSLSVAGVALSIMVVLVLNGVLAGVIDQTGSYLEHAPGSVVLAPAGTDNFLLATTALPPATETTVEALPEVAAVAPILSRMVVVRLHDRREASFLIGFDPERGGGPSWLGKGRLPSSDNEVVVDRLLAGRHDIGIEDSIDILGQPFTVSGLSGETSPLMTSFVFVRKQAMESLVLAPGASSFLLVTPEQGLSPSQLRDRLGDLTGTQAYLENELIDNDVEIFTAAFQPPIRLMAGIASVIGVLVVGLIIFAATTERRREYGVMKAIGIHNRLLYRVVAAQASIVAISGVAMGILLGFVASRLIMKARPEYLVTLTPRAIAFAAIVGMSMGLIASLAPTRVIAGLAPADVFRG